tara:strand:+ start:223 stop:624 length:402 start_codon:yes stop_codon:yes gene_type:complete
MPTKDVNIRKLEDLEKLRSSPKLNKEQAKLLFNEVKDHIHKADWLTIGVMSPTLKKAINAIRMIEERFHFSKMKCITLPSTEAPIYLKANQKTGEIHARIEYGLGVGILITCQNHDNSISSKTVGPLPLDFFD